MAADCFTPLTPYEEAREQILQLVNPLPAEVVDLDVSGGRVSHNNICATNDAPPFSQSTMDGYAISTETYRQTNLDPEQVIFSITCEVAAGQVPPNRPIQIGQAARIFTGAAIPPGANAVVMQEDTTRNGDKVTLHRSVEPFENIRRQGSDFEKSHTIISAGNPIYPGELSLLATQRLTEIAVHKKPVVAIIPTGDELSPPGIQDNSPYKIADSNSQLLRELVTLSGGIPSLFRPIPDDPELTEKTLRDASQNADLILTTGGASVGDRDYIREIFHRNGEVLLWKVAVKPGKPLLAGTFSECPMIALPGNPASAFVGFHLFAAPTIRKLSGHHRVFPLKLQVTLAQDVKPLSIRTHFIRGNIRHEEGMLLAFPKSSQNSGHLLSLVDINALIEIPPGPAILPKGSKVAAQLVSQAAFWQFKV
ncbi:MAG: gephyrin-like molybdotransferase Glp [Myxococcota bacterium]|nr:gephyrin-like molybdotransferase Glp [Myxococcota bacterium]